jgi:voltage-gated potassium channel Kch
MENEQYRQDYRRIQRSFRYAAALALGVLVIGAVFYHHVEHLKWLDAFYFCTVTLATVGYGDITPHTDLGKLFTIFYILFGIGILATFANLLVKNAVARRQIKQYTKDQSEPASKHERNRR